MLQLELMEVEFMSFQRIGANLLLLLLKILEFAEEHGRWQEINVYRLGSLALENVCLFGLEL